MKRNILMIAIVAGLFFASCNQTNNNRNRNASERNTPITSRNVVGSFEGTIPCADCSGIKKKLTLNSDHTFVMESTYLGKGNERPFVDRGTYRVQNGRVILSVKDQPSQYRIDRTSLEQLDMEGHRIRSNHNYTLTRQ